MYSTQSRNCALSIDLALLVGIENTPQTAGCVRDPLEKGTLDSADSRIAGQHGEGCSTRCPDHCMCHCGSFLAAVSSLPPRSPPILKPRTSSLWTQEEEGQLSGCSGLPCCSLALNPLQSYCVSLGSARRCHRDRDGGAGGP